MSAHDPIRALQPRFAAALAKAEASLGTVDDADLRAALARLGASIKRN